MANVTKVGLSYPVQQSSDGSVSVVVPADADCIVFTGANYIGAPLATGGSTSGLSFSNENEMRFQYIGSGTYNDTEPELSAYLMTASSAYWPGTGTKTLYFKCPSYTEGMDGVVTFWKNVDQSNPVVDVEETNDFEIGNPFTSPAMTGVSAEDMSICAMDWYATSDTTGYMDENGQTVIQEGTGFNVGLLCSAYKLGAASLTATGPHNAFASVTFALRAATGGGGTPTSLDVGRADEADSALALGRIKYATAQRADSVDTALSLARTKSALVGRADETDAALALTRLKARTSGLSVESSLALALSATKLAQVGRADSVEAALAVVAARTKAVGIAIETDSALGLAGFKFMVVGRADEVDTALSLFSSGGLAVGLATEQDTALALVGVKLKVVALATESDVALALAYLKTAAVARADESDAAFSMVAVKLRSTSFAAESDAAIALSGLKLRTVSLATEVEAALALLGVKLTAVGRADEVDTPLALVGARVAATGRADEIETALSLSGFKSRAVQRANEVDTAYRLLPAILWTIDGAPSVAIVTAGGSLTVYSRGNGTMFTI